MTADGLLTDIERGAHALREYCDAINADAVVLLELAKINETLQELYATQGYGSYEFRTRKTLA